MKWIVIGVGCLAMSVSASMLEISSGTLSSGAKTIGSGFSSALSVQSSVDGEVLVIGTFSAQASETTGSGQWQLSSVGEDSSRIIQRSLDAKKDAGIGSVVHVFNNVSAGNDINLMHSSTDAGNELTTSGANLVVIPLSVSTGEKLNYGVYQQDVDAGVQVSSGTFSATGVKTSVRLDRDSNNGVYMAASFNAQSISSAGTGNWQLQYREKTEPAGAWIPTGNTMTRAMNSASDVGSVTLYALEEGLGAGEYEIQLVCKSENGSTAIETLNGTLAAVSLSYTNNSGGGYFDGFMATSTDLNEADVLPYEDVQGGLVLEEDSSAVFAAMSFSGTAEAGKNRAADFDLYAVDGAAGTFTNEANARYFGDTSDWGSGGSVAHFTDVAAGDITVYGRYAIGAGSITTKDVTLVGFSAEAIPEPSVITFIALSGGLLLVARRIFGR